MSLQPGAGRAAVIGLSAAACSLCLKAYLQGRAQAAATRSLSEGGNPRSLALAGRENEAARGGEQLEGEAYCSIGIYGAENG